MGETTTRKRGRPARPGPEPILDKLENIVAAVVLTRPKAELDRILRRR
jgi:hypothetical protein